MAVTQMIIVAFAVTAFLIGAILGLRFRVCVLIAVVFLSLIVIVAFGLLHGKSLGFIFFCRILWRNGDGIWLLYRSN
ncbi:MAG: hypothetical protein WA750_01310, partial [Pseudolabrys sp.]